MTGFRNWLLRPPGLHVWRWRALTAWVIMFTVLVGLLLGQHHDQTQRAEQLAMQNRIQNVQQQRVLVNLCNRGYVSLGVIDVLLDALPRQYHNELNVYRNILVGQLTNKESPCVTVGR